VNVLFITSSDLRGQQFNGYLLYDALLKQGHDANMVVAEKLVDEPGIHQLPSLPSFWNKVNNKLIQYEQKEGLQATLPISSLPIYGQSYYRNCDVVHLQLIHASPFFSLLNIPYINQTRPIVWTMHDPWLTTGHCLHSLTCDRWLAGCGNCPDLNLPIPVKKDRTAFNWKLKKWIAAHSKIHLVVTSQWMAQRVEKSPVLSQVPYSLIPFGVDTSIYKPVDKRLCRKMLKIPEDSYVLAFRSTRWIYKGLPYIQSALRKLKLDKPTYLITFDDVGCLDSIGDEYHLVELGYVSDRTKTAQALGAADVFLAPSLAETFGMMAIESMACGTPVIAFEGTSLPAVIHAPDAGVVVPYKDTDAFANAIQTLLINDDYRRQLSENALKVIQQEYTFDLYIKRHFDLYQSVSNI